MTQRWRAAYGLALSNRYRFADMRLTDLSQMVDRYVDLILAQPMGVLFPPEKRSS
jgi:hypothetical protein